MAKVIIPDKICSHCGGNEWYIINSKRDGISYHCVKKIHENYINYHKTHKIKSKAWQQKYYSDNKERILAYHKEYRHTPEGKASMRRSEKKEQTTLSNRYVKRLIYSAIYLQYKVRIQMKNITQEQINKYRESIQVQRQLKQLM